MLLKKWFCGLQVWKRRRTQRGNVFRQISDSRSDAEFGKIYVKLSRILSSAVGSHLSLQSVPWFVAEIECNDCGC
jgi:hypothetical protein